MKRVSLFASLLIVAPALALAQTPPTPPLPPPPPPAPQAAVPPVPPPAPVAPRVIVPAMVDSVMIADALLAAQDASMAATINAQAIRDAARAAADQVYTYAVSTPQVTVDLQQRLLADMQGMQMNYGGGDYNSGMSLMNQRKYDEAITRFDRIVNTKGSHADGALYWKAWCQAKLGKSDDAVATLAILKKDYPQSPYLKDAQFLQADVRKLGPSQVDNEDLKLLALQGIQNQNPQLAIAPLEKVLNDTTNSQRIRSQALYVLATNDDPKAHQILLNYAKGGGNPDLQLSAISYLANRGQKTSSQELIDIYTNSSNTDVRLAVIRAFRSAGAKGPLMAIASGNGIGATTYVTTPGGRGANAVASSGAATRGGGAGGRGAGAGAGAGSGMTPEELSQLAQRRVAINALTDLASPAELWPLYQKEENKDLRMEWVNTFSSMGAVDQLLQIVNTEKDPAVRLRAVRSLGNTRSDKAGPALAAMYASGDRETKSAVISALGSQNNPESLIAVYEKETDLELKRQIVSQVANMAGKSQTAMDFLLKIIK